MDSGCLIHYENLQIGEILFDIFLGEVCIVEINLNEEYPITCKKIGSEEFTNARSYTIDGKNFNKEIYPKLYKKDPFKYAFEIAREKTIENKALCTTINLYLKKIQQLEQKKDVS